MVTLIYILVVCSLAYPVVGRDDDLDIDDLAPGVGLEDGPLAVGGRVRALRLRSPLHGLWVGRTGKAARECFEFSRLTIGEAGEPNKPRHILYAFSRESAQKFQVYGESRTSLLQSAQAHPVPSFAGSCFQLFNKRKTTHCSLI